MSDHSVIWQGFEVHGDETLPPDHIKLLSGGTASVFRLEEESPALVAQWPETLPISRSNSASVSAFRRP